MSKKVLIRVIAICVIIMCCILIIEKKSEKKFEIKQANSEYEEYLDKDIYGSDLATLIEKAINRNENNGVKKNEKNHYIENNKNSIKIEIKMSDDNNTYQMEQFYNKGIKEFVKYFGNINFRCTSIEYHKKTGQVKKLIFEEMNK